MGYSIGVYARSKALQKRMLDFMEKEYRLIRIARPVKSRLRQPEPSR